MYAVLEEPDRVVKSVCVTTATSLVVATNDVNVVVSTSVDMIVAMPGFAIDMYPTI